MESRTRKGLLAAAIAGLLVAAYVAAGYGLAPRFVRDALQGQASRMGLELRLGDVRTDPFALSVALTDIELLAPGGHRIAFAPRARADIAWRSLWGPAWIVEQASLQQPELTITRTPSGDIAWLRPGDTPAAGPAPGIVLQHLAIAQGAVRFTDHSRGAPVTMQFETVGLDVKELSTGLPAQSREPAQYEVTARLADGGTITSQGRVSIQPLAAHGDIALAGVAVATAWPLAAPGSPPPGGQLNASATFAYDGERLALRGVALEAANVVYGGVTLPQVILKAPKLAIPSEAAFEVQARASVSPGGRAEAQGTIGLQPFRADLKVEAAGLSIAQAQPWVPGHIKVRIGSGTLALDGRLRMEHDDAAYQGAVALRDVRLEEPGSRELLLGWTLLETREASLRLSPLALEMGEVLAQAPVGRLIIEEDGRINFADIFAGGTGSTREGEPSRATVQRLGISNGTLEFADRSLDNDFAVTIHELAGAITGLGTVPGNPARVALAGRVEKYGEARIRGTVNLDQPKSLTNISASFRNLDLAALTPYIVKFAGYRVESGRLSAELRYRVREARLVGENQLAIERLNLGEKVESATALDIPIELAIALLSDAQGRINLAIPVRGDLNDPQFDLGGLFAKALGNVIGRIASAPFRALAALLGEGGMDLGAVRFEPGAVALAPPEEETLARVAKALGERPQLGVTVRGGYDPQRDPQALKTRTVRRQIAQRAGYEAQGPLDFRDPKILQAAERLYLDRVGNRLEMLALRDADQPYGRLLVEKIAAATPVAPGTAETLALARAETVRAALLAQGVEPSRVQLEAPVTEEAGAQGVPTTLALRADMPAQAQQGAAPAVEQVQKTLNAQGFGAGPVDGILGPMTRSALRDFQQSNGLEATGALDPRTLAALGVRAEASAGGTTSGTTRPPRRAAPDPDRPAARAQH